MKNNLELRLELNGKILFETQAADVAAEIKIGRAPDCAWRIPPTDKTASNHHAVILKKRGRLVIRDDGSKNGLFAKGVKFTEHKITAGDSIAIGDCRLVAEAAADKGAAEKLEFHRLELLNGVEAGRMYDLKGDCVRIGSGPDNDIACADPLVSGRHAQLTFKRDGSCWAKDLESRNGTLVNKTKLSGSTERMLRDGDILSIAYLEFRFLDKNAVHVRSYIGAKILAAAATIAVGVVAYYGWNSVSPDSRTLIDRAIEEARAGNFDAAAELMEKSTTARNAKAYKMRREKTLEDLPEWKKNSHGWTTAQQALAKSRWRDAYNAFGEVAKWPPGSKAEEVRAEAAKKLTFEFWEARRQLTVDEKIPGKNLDTLKDAGRSLQEALDIAARLDKGTPPAYFAPLMDISRDVLGEIQLTLDTYARIDAAIASIGKDANTASSVRAEVEAIRQANDAHNAERRAEQETNKFLYALYSGEVPARCARVLPMLEELEKCETLIAKKIENIAMRRDKGVPAETFAFAAIYDAHPNLETRHRALEAKLADLNDIAKQLDTRLSALDEDGFTPAGKISTAMSLLFNAAFVGEVFEFVKDGDPYVGYNSNDAGSGSYDRLVGIHQFCEFLNNPGDWRADLVAAQFKFVPELVKVRISEDKFRALIGYVANDKKMKLWRAEVDAVPGSLAKQYVDFAQSLLKKRSTWAEDMEDRLEKETSERAKILIAGMLLMLDPKPSEKKMENLERDWRALKNKMQRNMSEEEIWRQGFPGLVKFQEEWQRRIKEKQ